MTRQPATVRVVSISMADGSDINSPEVRQRIGRAFLSIPILTDTAPQGVQQASEKRPA